MPLFLLCCPSVIPDSTLFYSSAMALLMVVSFAWIYCSMNSLEESKI